MPYLVDGHNLIPKVPGLSLTEVDDEMQLVELLVEFCRREHKQVEVYFDKAPPGGQRARNFGQVVARFASGGRSADDAIRERLKRLGNAARNWTVVSSDREVQAEARAARAEALSSAAFAELMFRKIEGGEGDLGDAPDAGLEGDDLEEWLHLFGE